ncbi:MAG TPA: YidC/Oxa1 family membrane protein insertase [Solirubrobacteraceae bacterium]|nr:YidC/Oxa1 family membrane protein insertase [Solirubrobacteraceae bacterium]
MLVTANIFQPLIDVFESVLTFFHNNLGIGWGWSIILLTVAVRAVLLPLTFRQIKSMVRMQALAPQMKEIQKKYKDNKERQSQEMMKFYRENNVNPLGSCLPLVLQLPVFVGLYYMLRESLRKDICPQVQAAYQAAHHTTNTTACGAGHGAGFLFIPDLTDKATGWVLVVLIILYVGSQLGSTLVMSSAATMDPMQRRMMMFLPLVFVLFIFRFPAGLLVYWITTNLWTVAQQWVVRQRIGPRLAASDGDTIDSTAGPPGDKAKGSGARSGPGSATASKALPKGESGNGKGDAAPATGGLAALFRGRLQPSAESESGGTNGKGDGDSGASVSSGSRSRTSPGSSSGSSSGRGSRSARGSGSGSSSSKASGRASGGGSGGSGSGGSGGSGSGQKPPPPPRKRKKRSGRRR